MSVTLSSVSTKAVIYQNDDCDSFLRKLAAIVAQVYVTFSQISQNERAEIHKLELDYKSHSLVSADAMRSMGRLTFAGACFGVLLFAASLGFSNTNDKKFVQLISEKSPDIARLFESSRQAKSKSQDTIAQLDYSKLQDKNNKSASDGNSKEQFAQVLQAEIQRLRTASSSAN